VSNTTAEHKSQAPVSVRCAVITVSDTRTVETDTGGRAIAESLTAAGHYVAQRQIVPDDPERIAAVLQQLCGRDDVDAVLLTGGTGITRRDQTYETVCGLFTKPLPGYGELFRMLSYQQIGAAAMLSRAVGGLVGQTVLLTMPGSPAAVRLAMDQVILPELGHLVREARR
jgi:molybdenum cofactor biosynthesis protein B